MVVGIPVRSMGMQFDFSFRTEREDYFPQTIYRILLAFLIAKMISRSRQRFSE